LDSYLKRILRKIFPPASVVVIKGDWKTGKTDYALRLIEWLFDLNIIQKFSSNVWIDPEQIDKYNIPFKFIRSIPSLRKWSIPPMADKKSKAFIYDEAVSTSPGRRAMSKLNTEWLKLIPELSKGRLKLIVCVHATKYMDSVFLDKTYLRGVINKWARKEGERITESYARLTYPNIRSPKGVFEQPYLPCPRTHFKFDPYRIAEMSIEADMDLDLDERFKILHDYVYEGKSFTKIAKENRWFPQQVKRKFIDALKILMEERLPSHMIKQKEV